MYINLYHIKEFMISKAILKRIDQKYSLIQKMRPLSPTLVRKLKEQFSLDMTYNSNAIEGNKLTLKETYLIINDGITVKGKSLKDHLEAKNHHDALYFLFDLIKHEKKHTINERLIRSLQQLIIKDIEDDDAGKYRQGNVIITGSKHKPATAYRVPQLMEDLIIWIKKNEGKIHPVELAAKAHHKLVHIHPFTDGNGRTARLFMNLILMQKGYPLVTILKNDRKKYYSALEKADAGNFADFGKFIAQAVERSMNIYLKAIGSGSSKYESLVLLSGLAKSNPYSKKYLNLLARSGKLDAHKEGRNWLSSQKALNEYLANRIRKHKVK